MPDPVNEETARKRWMAMQVVRLGGVAMVVIGILIAERGIAEPPAVGYLLAIVGLVGVFLVPRLLARKWRTPL